MSRSTIGNLARGAATACAVLACAIGSLACAPQPFQRDLHDQRWLDAARTFDADSSLMNNERALYEAALLYGSPGRPTFDPDRAAQLYRRLLARFPNTQYRAEATDRLALVSAILSTRDSTAARRSELESKVDELTAEVRQLQSGLDSVRTRGDSLRRSSSKLEADLRDRDEQLRALRLELKQLKDVDLKPRQSPRPP